MAAPPLDSRVRNNMRVTGVYKITNISNGKFYVGQSRDIFTRWKTHTMSITECSRESVIRMAFAKYGLRQQVSKEGAYDGFKFEIIEKCPEKNLLEREFYYIKLLNPEYNVQLMGATPYFVKKDLQRSKHFIQYHSLEKMGYFPGESDDQSVTTENANYGIFSRKRLATNMMGASVVLILGGRPENCKLNRYYLWSELLVEDVQFDEENRDYLIQGIQNLPETPIDLTDINGFDNFRMRCGNFAYGLQSVENKIFFNDIIKPLLKSNRSKKVISYNQWINDFLVEQDRIYLKSNYSSQPTACGDD